GENGDGHAATPGRAPSHQSSPELGTASVSAHRPEPLGGAIRKRCPRRRGSAGEAQSARGAVPSLRLSDAPRPAQQRRPGVKRKRTYRIYREEGLQVRTKRRKKLLRPRVPMLLPSAVNERWSIDFVSDQLANGRRFRIANVV